MTSDKAIDWLNREQFNNWILLRGDEKAASQDSDESVSDGIDRFRDIIALQMPGKFTLKGYRGKSKQSSAMTFPFEVKPEPIQSSRPQNSSFNAEELFNRAKDAAYREFQMEQWRKDVEKDISMLKADLESLKKSVFDLHDDDEDNDESAMDRLQSGMTKIPELMEGLKGLSALKSL